jgi:hypothetical protein
MSGAMYSQGPAMSMAMDPASAGHSSPESFEVEDEHNSMSSAHWQMHGQTSSDPAAQSSRAPAPLQKRRRVTRACDECRRKKIKCDGKQPCTHCTVYSYGMIIGPFVIDLRRGTVPLLMLVRLYIRSAFQQKEESRSTVY